MDRECSSLPRQTIRPRDYTGTQMLRTRSVFLRTSMDHCTVCGGEEILRNRNLGTGRSGERDRREPVLSWHTRLLLCTSRPESRCKQGSGSYARTCKRTVRVWLLASSDLWGFGKK